MSLRHILTCLVISSVLATVAESKPVAANGAQVEHREIPSYSLDDFVSYYGGLRGRDHQHEMRSVPRTHVRTPQSSAATRISRPKSSSFEDDFNKIQYAAAKLVAIQELAKQKGAFSADDNKVYANSLFELGKAAQNLAQLQQTGQIPDFNMLLQAEIRLPQSMQKVEENMDEKTQKFEDELLPTNSEDPYEDTVSVGLPKKDASIAEAKPQGLSIAGVGGVASSKPNAVALSGLNGLAVASPKATAIAGVSPEDAAAYNISLPSRNNLIIKSGQNVNTQSSSAGEEYDYVDLENSKSSASSLIPTASPSNSNNAFVSKWKKLIAANIDASSRSTRRNNK